MIYRELFELVKMVPAGDKLIIPRELYAKLRDTATQAKKAGNPYPSQVPVPDATSGFLGNFNNVRVYVQKDEK